MADAKALTLGRYPGGEWQPEALFCPSGKNYAGELPAARGLWRQAGLLTGGRDGELDLASANYYANRASILLGTGDASSSLHTNYVTDYYPLAVVAADFNGDGKLDLAVLTACATLKLKRD